MNDRKTPAPDARGREPEDAGLPDLSEDAIERMEHGVFASIDDEREWDGDRSAAAPRPRRRRLLWGLGAAAAVIAIAAVIAPSVIGSWGAQSTAIGEPVSGAPHTPDLSGGVSGFAEEESGIEAIEADGVIIDGSAPDRAVGSADSGIADADREIITTGATSLVVASVPDAADEITRLVDAHGGRVQELNLGGPGYHPLAEDTGDDDIPQGWVMVRVPAASFDALRADLADVGDVLSNEVATSDVTEATVDLRARIDAAQASVTRLTELMGDAESVADLLSAEQALSERQAELESLQAQLESLEGQVAMSTLTIDLTREHARVQPEPQGFGDGLVTGWNSFVATLNGIVIGLGFLVPWLGAVAVVLLAVWGIIRIRRRSRGTESEDAAE